MNKRYQCIALLCMLLLSMSGLHAQDSIPQKQWIDFTFPMSPVYGYNVKNHFSNPNYTYAYYKGQNTLNFRYLDVQYSWDGKYFLDFAFNHCRRDIAVSRISQTLMLQLPNYGVNHLSQYESEGGYHPALRSSDFALGLGKIYNLDNKRSIEPFIRGNLGWANWSTMVFAVKTPDSNIPNVHEIRVHSGLLTGSEIGLRFKSGFRSDPQSTTWTAFISYQFYRSALRAEAVSRDGLTLILPSQETIVHQHHIRMGIGLYFGKMR